VAHFLDLNQQHLSLAIVKAIFPPLSFKLQAFLSSCVTSPSRTTVASCWGKVKPLHLRIERRKVSLIHFKRERERERGGDVIRIEMVVMGENITLLIEYHNNGGVVATSLELHYISFSSSFLLLRTSSTLLLLTLPTTTIITFLESKLRHQSV
jgi:hypothetical protein